MKSGNLNFPEPSGPLQACNGTALPLLLRILLQINFALVIIHQVAFEIRTEIRVGLHVNSPLKSTDFQQIWKISVKSPLQELIKILSASLLL